jgi:hypothetical protein
MEITTIPNMYIYKYIIFHVTIGLGGLEIERGDSHFKRRGGHRSATLEKKKMKKK